MNRYSLVLLLLLPNVVACSDDSSDASLLVEEAPMTESPATAEPEATPAQNEPQQMEPSPEPPMAEPASPEPVEPEPAAPEVLENSIAAIAAADGRFSTLVGALQATGLDAPLAAEGTFTVFAPTDEAFALLPEGLVDSLDAETLKNVLEYHVVGGASVDAATAVTLQSAETLLGEELALGVDGDTLYLNGLTAVTMTDIQAANGVIHVIDSVLIPGAFPGTIVDVVTSYPRLSTLAGAATAGAVEALSADGRTLFAPVNGAFEGVELPADASVLEDILLYHGLATNEAAAEVVGLKTAQAANGAFVGVKVDQGVQLDDGTKLTNVIYTDIAASNGTIHLIDNVLIPPGTIAEVAQGAGLSSLVTALAAANVPGTEVTFAEAAGAEGPLTVFAPSNDALSKIPTAGFGDDLANVLGAHVVSGAIDSTAVVAAIEGGQTPETLTGSQDNVLQLSLSGDAVRINSLVTVTMTDIPARNGIIHLIDSVIVPSSVTFPGTLVDAVAAYPSLSSLVEAVSNADPAVVAALTGDAPLTLFAPLNAAFDGVDTTADLANTLLYHATSGAVDSAFVLSELAAGGDVLMANGQLAQISGATLTINDANISRVDLRAQNGIIHIIDKVLAPAQ